MTYRNLFTELPAEAEVDTVKKDTTELSAEAGAMDNSTLGQCPKCKGGMSPSQIAGGEEVSYCAQCRVTAPLAN